MSIKWSDDLISGYLDHELDSNQRSFVELEVANDPSKAELLKRLLKQRAAIKAMPAVRLEKDLTASILAEAASRRESQTARVVKPVEPQYVEPKYVEPKYVETEYSVNRQNWRVAAAALSALAACLLISVFAIQIEPNNGVAVSSADPSQPPLNDNLNANLGADEEGSEGARTDVGGSGQAAGKSRTGRDLLDNKQVAKQVISQAKDDDAAANGMRGATSHLEMDSSNRGAEAAGLAENSVSPNNELAKGKEEASVSVDLAKNEFAVNDSGTNLPNYDQFALGSSIDLEANIDQVIMIKMHPDDIRRQQVALTLKELKFSLVGEDQPGVFDTLFVDTSVASLNILLTKLGGEQKLTPVPSHKDSNEWGTEIQMLNDEGGDVAESARLPDTHVQQQASVDPEVSEDDPQSPTVPGLRQSQDVVEEEADLENFEQHEANLKHDESNGIARIAKTYDMKDLEQIDPLTADVVGPLAIEIEGWTGMPWIAKAWKGFHSGMDESLGSYDPGNADSIDSGAGKKNRENDGLTNSEMKNSGIEEPAKLVPILKSLVNKSTNVRSLILIIPDEGVERMVPVQTSEPFDAELPEMFNSGSSKSDPNSQRNSKK